MGIIAPINRVNRPALAAWYRRNRSRSAQLFGLIDEGSYFDRPIALRHPFLFYEGHLPAFSLMVVNERALGEPPVNAHLEKIFERGIDPSSVTDARRHERADWPTRDEVEAFARLCDERLEHAIAYARLDNPDVPRLVRAQGIYTALEHEQMHHETLLYIIHQLGYDKKGRIAQAHHDHPTARNDVRPIDAGAATLGANADDIAFGWDNEFGRHVVDVPAFGISRFPVTNADYLKFVQQGGPVPPFWVERDGDWYLRAAFEELPLPLSWPVYVSHAQANAYARWKGLRLPTEAQFHRAAFGAPDGEERAYPWGNEVPNATHGNFDFERYDPEPVDMHPAGASAWDVHDLIGNGWEWTSTIFAPFPGFEPMASYPQYSTDFFDGKHYVMKGASPVTAREMVRRSFRNWFYDDYPYMYAKFRCVA